jgi:hypothetical protein
MLVRSSSLIAHIVHGRCFIARFGLVGGLAHKTSMICLFTENADAAQYTGVGCAPCMCLVVCGCTFLMGWNLVRHSMLTLVCFGVQYPSTRIGDGQVWLAALLMQCVFSCAGLICAICRVWLWCGCASGALCVGSARAFVAASNQRLWFMNGAGSVGWSVGSVRSADTRGPCTSSPGGVVLRRLLAGQPDIAWRATLFEPHKAFKGGSFLSRDILRQR